jgi:hypothetical protein
MKRRDSSTVRVFGRSEMKLFDSRYHAADRSDVTSMARFTVTDVFSRAVVGPFSAWDHILQRHPEMADKEDVVKETITTPITVHELPMSHGACFEGKQ